MNMPMNKLLQDFSRRWHSSYYMLKRLVEICWPTSTVLSDEKVTKRADEYLDLKNDHWDLAKELLGPLNKLKLLQYMHISEEKKDLFLVSFQFYMIISTLQMKTQSL